jgi:hypothetical protein
VFLIDDAGVVWGRRVSVNEAAPIPIEPGTVQVRLLFPSDAAITKYEFSFDFAQSLMDFELVPVFADAGLLNYVPRIAVRLDVWWTPTVLTARIYAVYARSAGNFFIPIEGLAPFLVVRDNTGTIINATFTEQMPGMYQANISSLSSSGNPHTIRVGASAPTGAFDYTTAVAEFNV